MENIEKTTAPKKKTGLYILLSLMILCLAAGAVFISENYSDKNISISVSEDEDELIISARYPEEKTAKVHEYLRNQLDLSNLTSLNHVNVKKYITADDMMEVSLKSTPGYFKIVLNKHRNSREAYRTLKEAGKGIGTVFTHTTLSSFALEPIFYGFLFFLPIG